MSIDPTTLAVPFYLILIGVELLVHVYTKRKSYRVNDALTNINLGITSKVTDAFLSIVSFGMYIYIFDQWRIMTIPTNVFTWILAFVIGDLCFYWAHRKSHEINLFWGGHGVHHQSEEYNLSVALRQSSLETIWAAIFYLPMAFIGIEPLTFVSVLGFNLLYQFWIHTESIQKLPRWFEAVFNTPSHHRVHHARNPKYIDKNHAGTLIIWDKMFGTFIAEQETPTYGITKSLNSWNPVWANVSHYGDMLKDMKRIPRWRDRLAYIVKPPGWLPQSMGGQRLPPDIEPEVYKYDAKASRKLNGYIFFQYVLLAGGTFAYLLQMPYFDQHWVLKTLTGVAIICSTMSFGALFESRSWATALEIFRLIWATCLTYYLILGFTFSALYISVAFVFLAVSILWLYRVKP